METAFCNAFIDILNHERDKYATTNVIDFSDSITVVINIAERLKAAREIAGLTQEQVAAAAGISQGTVANIESGIRKAPRELMAIARSVNVHPEWLKSGRGPRELVDLPKASSRSNLDFFSNVSPGPALRGKVPLISWIQAGAWCQAEESILPREAERWFDCPVGHSTSTFTLRVRGDSMTAPHGNSRTYPEGSFIFVDPEQRQPDNGDRVVACLEGSDEVTFKVYKNEDGRQWLQPLNPSHEPIRERFKILGKVLGKWEDG
jgi:SOS-response transcriptional repressor LexA